MDIVRIVNQHQEHLITYRREELIILKPVFALRFNAFLSVYSCGVKYMGLWASESVKSSHSKMVTIQVSWKAIRESIHFF